MRDQLNLAQIGRFEDLSAWQKARALTQGLYQHLQGTEGLFQQIKSVAVTVMSSLAEGFERGNGDFPQYAVFARANCAELRSLLYVALDAKLIDDTTFEQFHSQALELGRLCTDLMRSSSRARPWQEGIQL
ncbi:hypothetical protein ANRL4_00754 [Anaerolineae bacterium]|nr:hypothetical protein ANRL4_00754 [Anaerolineae bacterium]